MAIYRIGAEVRVRGTFTVELRDGEEIEPYVKKLERDDLEVLQLLTDNAFDASGSEIDDIALLGPDGKYTDVYFN